MRHPSHRPWFVGLLALPLAASFAGSRGPAQPSAQQEVDAERRAELVQAGRQLQRSFSAMRVARQSLEREAFDPAALAATLGADVDAIFAWVRDETRWMPYRGALRGPRGVVADRMGSHLDRALLLADLLERAGHEVRLARATLTEAEVEALVDVPTAELPARDDAGNGGDLESLQAELTRAAQLLDTDVSELAQRVFEARTASERMSERVVLQGAQQRRALASALGWSDDEARAEAGDASALADLWWVQLRRADAWLDLDPARRAHAPGDRSTEQPPAATYSVAGLPADLRHRLRVEVVAERVKEAEREENVVLAHELLTSDVPCETITLLWGPLGGEQVKPYDDAGDLSPERLRQSALEVREWLPTLRAGDALVSKASVRADGSVNQTPGKGFVGRGFGDALDGLRGGQDPDAHLTAVHLQYTVTAPGREPEVFRRPVFDLLGPAARAAGSPFVPTEDLRLQRSMTLCGVTQVLLQPCWLSPELAVDRWLGSELKNNQARLGIVQAMSRGDRDAARAALGSIQPPDGQLVFLAAQRRDRSPHADRIALTRLNLLGLVRTPGWDGDQPIVRVGFDIVQNAVEVLPGAAASARDVRLGQGVVDTILEAELVSAGDDVANAARSFGATLGSGEEVCVLRRPADLEPRAAGLDPDGRARIAAALDAGQVVVLAATPAPDVPAQWWRIDPERGDCLGIGAEGRGQGEAVKAIALISVSLSIIGGLQCVGQNDDRMGCCMAAWIVGLVGEAGLAIYLGGVTGAAVALGAAIAYGLLVSDLC